MAPSHECFPTPLVAYDKLQWLIESVSAGHYVNIQLQQLLKFGAWLIKIHYGK